MENEEQEDEKREEEEVVAPGETTIFKLSNIPIVCKTEEVHTEELLVEEVSGIARCWSCTVVDKKNQFILLSACDLVACHMS